MESGNQQNDAKNNKGNDIIRSSLQSKVNTFILNGPHDEAPKHYVVVQTKRKKEVIQISSSQSEAQIRPRESQTLLKPLPTLEKSDRTKKIKKTVFKCQLCKASGKKAQMKVCLKCKHNFHMSCIENDENVPKRYLCEKCRFQKEQQRRQQSRKLIQELKVTPIQVQKPMPKKTQKQRKREDLNKRFIQFCQRYPYYIMDQTKIKFPIQDKLLLIYRQIFQNNPNQTTRPTPSSHPLIPNYLLGDLMQIQNFFLTFQEELQVVGWDGGDKYQVGKVRLFRQMTEIGIDQQFSAMVFCLIKVYLTDIFEKNKTDNVKMLNQNCFFTLLTNMNENQDLTQNLIVLAAEEIMRYLATIPSMKKSFDDFVFPATYNLQSKIYILVSLIKGLSQVDTFHELVAAKSQKMQNLTKQKGQLINKLKTDQAQNLQKKQKMKQFANVDLQLDDQLNKNEQNESVKNTRQLTREKDKNKKKLLKLSNEKQKSQRSILQIRSKILQISKKLPFVTSKVIFVGRDRNQSQYFFFIQQPNRLYCKYKNYLFDQADDLYIYEGKQIIMQLVKTFNIKGIREKHLADLIVAFLKDQVIKDVIIDDRQIHVVKQPVHQEVDINQVVTMLQDLENIFSNYLAMKNLQWTNQVDRQIFLSKLQTLTSDDLQQLKRMIVTLQESFLFVEPIPQINGRMLIIDSDEQNQYDKKQSKKKSPARLWGINSERIKKYWVQYLEQSVDVKGIWICTNVFKNYVDRYVKKKMEYLVEQQKKQQKVQKQKEKLQKHRLRKERQDRDQDKQSRQRSRQQRPRGRRPNNRIIQSSQSIAEQKRPYLRQRRKKKFQIDSDVQIQSSYHQQSDQNNSNQNSSKNEQLCQVCQQYGEMICCDTCPKVFHLQCLGMKQIPQGEWSCVKCLEQITNSRQTRSRAAKNVGSTNTRASKY